METTSNPGHRLFIATSCQRVWSSVSSDNDDLISVITIIVRPGSLSFLEAEFIHKIQLSLRPF